MSSVPSLGLPVQVAIPKPVALGESPLWHPDERVLYHCDILGRRVVRFDPRSGERREIAVDSDAACIAPIADSTDLLLACRDGLWRLDTRDGRRTPLVPPPYDPAQERFNDGKCDPAGRFWAGTIFEPRQPQASLHRYDGGGLVRVAGGITTSNGLAWSPDARTMYWSDTRAHTVFAFDFDSATGQVGERRVFAAFAVRDPADDDLSRYGGRPDGAAVDVEGCYWVAMYEGACVLRLSPRGEVICAVRLPVRCPTMPCFGGDDLRTLYITSAREGRPAAELAQQPLAGCVLSVRVDVPGLAAQRFRAV